MTLAERWGVCLPTLELMMAGLPVGASVSFGDDGTLFIHPDGDTSAIGFVEGPVGETLIDMTMRLIDSLGNDLPLSRRLWGRPMPPCPLNGHSHAMVTRPDHHTMEVDFYCPDAHDQVVARITFAQSPRLVRG